MVAHRPRPAPPRSQVFLFLDGSRAIHDVISEDVHGADCRCVVSRAARAKREQRGAATVWKSINYGTCVSEVCLRMGFGRQTETSELETNLSQLHGS